MSAVGHRVVKQHPVLHGEKRHIVGETNPPEKKAPRRSVEARFEMRRLGLFRRRKPCNASGLHLVASLSYAPGEFNKPGDY